MKISSYERFKKIQEMADIYDLGQLLEMWSMSMEHGAILDTSLEFAFAIIMKQNKQIEEIKQCLKAKTGEYDKFIKNFKECLQDENEEIVDALFGKITEEEKESKEGIKGWDI
jgi:hypothetical protein